MQAISSHKRDIQPSETTLDWCVDIVRTCGKRLSTICILASTPINHVSVANDAYESLQAHLNGGGRSASRAAAADVGTGSSVGKRALDFNTDLYSFDPHSKSSSGAGMANTTTGRSSSISPMSPGGVGAGLAISQKERRLILRVEAARAMLQEVASYIRLRLAEEMGEQMSHTRDRNYLLYKAVGTMHHWLLADDSLPAETREQQRLMQQDDARLNNGKAQQSIAALLVDKCEVPTYSYGALLQLISETEVGLLSKEFFPFEALTPACQKQLMAQAKKGEANGVDGQFFPCPLSEGIEGCDALNEALTPPPLPQLPSASGSGDVSTSATTPSRLSIGNARDFNTPQSRSTSVGGGGGALVAGGSPADVITPSFTRQLQLHIREIFTVWAQAMTTYFLHCEVLEDMERQQRKQKAQAEEAQRKKAEEEEEARRRLEKERLEREAAEAEAEEARRRQKESEEARRRQEEVAENVRLKMRRHREEEEAEAQARAERERLEQEEAMEKARQEEEEAARRMAEEEEALRREQQQRRLKEEAEREEAIRRARQAELEAEDAAHRRALEAAARLRDEELARLEAERRRIAEEERELEALRQRQLRAKEKLAEEEAEAKRKAALIAAQLRAQEDAARREEERLRRQQEEASRRRLEAEEEARRIAEEEEAANRRRKTALVRRQRIDDLLHEVEVGEEPAERSRLVAEEASDRQWAMTLERQEVKAALAREREARARFEEDELRRQQKALEQAEERMRYRMARQRAEDQERAKAEAEEEAKRQRLAALQAAAQQALDALEEKEEVAERKRHIDAEVAARLYLFDSEYALRGKALQRERARKQQEEAAARKAKEEELLRLAREAELRRLREEAEERRRREEEEEAAAKEAERKRLEEEAAARLQREEEEAAAAEELARQSRMKAARPMLISHLGEDSDDDENDDLRRRVAALERENKYLCEVVDGINNNHLRLHRQVLEANTHSTIAASSSVVTVSSSYDQTTVTSPSAAAAAVGRNKAANASSVSMRSSRSVDPLYADELPLPKTEELAIPRRSGPTTPRSNKQANPNISPFGSRGASERRSDSTSGGGEGAGGGGVSSAILSANSQRYNSIADRIRHEVATNRPVSAGVSRTQSSLNNTAAGVNRRSEQYLTADQRNAEREQQRKIDALYSKEAVAANIANNKGGVATATATATPPAAQRPSTAGPYRGDRLVSGGGGGAAFNSGPRSYGTTTNTMGLGGWNMYDEAGFSGAVGYVYDPKELDAPYLSIAANAPAWMHPKALQKAREDHLRQVQRALYGDALSASVVGGGAEAAAAMALDDLLTPEELAQVQERQRYEVRVVQQLLREIRARGGLDPLFEEGEGTRFHRSGPAVASLQLLPEPCVRLDFGTIAPWINDTHLLLILSTLLETAKLLAENQNKDSRGILTSTAGISHHANPASSVSPSLTPNTSSIAPVSSRRPSSAHYANSSLYPKSLANPHTAEALTTNVAATIRTIDISKCSYVSSDTVLLVLSDLVKLCPNLNTVNYNAQRFGDAESSTVHASYASAAAGAAADYSYAVSPVKDHDSYPASPDMRNSRSANASPNKANTTNGTNSTRNKSTLSRGSGGGGGVRGSDAQSVLADALAERAIAAASRRR